MEQLDSVRVDEWRAVAMAERQPVRSLTCCVCGEGTRGRQWWNRDDGFGICRKCAEWVQRHRPFGRDPVDAAEMKRLYGVHGVHYNVIERESGPSCPIHGTVTMDGDDCNRC